MSIEITIPHETLEPSFIDDMHIPDALYQNAEFEAGGNRYRAVTGVPADATFVDWLYDDAIRATKLVFEHPTHEGAITIDWARHFSYRGIGNVWLGQWCGTPIVHMPDNDGTPVQTKDLAHDLMNLVPVPSRRNRASCRFQLSQSMYDKFTSEGADRETEFGDPLLASGNFLFLIPVEVDSTLGDGYSIVLRTGDGATAAITGLNPAVMNV